MNLTAISSSRLLILPLVMMVFLSSCIVTTPVAYQPPSNPPPVYAAAPAPAPAPAPVVQPQPITLQTFYDELAPFGNWVNTPNRGYVWFPSVSPDFYPYSTGGHWTYT